MSLPDIPAGLEHMLPLFLAEMDKDARLLQAFAALPAAVVNLADLAEHAHAMRGKCAMFGEDTLFGLLTRLEQDCLNNMRDSLGALMAQIVERSLRLQVYA